MEAIAGLGMLSAVVLTIVWGAVVLAKRSRGRGISANGFGPLEELFHPAAHEASLVVEEQRERKTPLPTPDD